MSRVKVNEITNKVATGPVDFPDGITGVALTVTGNVTVGGTIISEDTTNVDSVGFVTARAGLNVGPPATGIGATIHSNGNAVFAGIVTASSFSGATELTGSTNNTLVTVTGANAITGESTLTYNASTYTLELQPSAAEPAIFIGDSNRTGAGQGLVQYKGNWNGTTVARITIDAGNDTTNKDDGIIRFDTAPSGSLVERLRITSSGGFNFSNGELIENCNVTAGKLSDNQTINLDNGMVHLFTTTETTTATPNIMSTIGINTSMSNGDAITVTLITTAAAGAYCANIQIDGAAVTENWIGGSAPSDGGSSGVDVHTFTIIKTASATFTVLGNQSKTS